MPVTNILCRTQRWFAFSKIGFCAGTKVFEKALNPVKFLGWLKKFGRAQNILGPVKGQGIRGKHCRHPIAVIGVVDSFEQYKSVYNSTQKYKLQTMCKIECPQGGSYNKLQEVWHTCFKFVLRILKVLKSYSIINWNIDIFNKMTTYMKNWFQIFSKLKGEYLLVVLKFTRIRVATYVADHESLLTQWRYI